MLNTMASSLKYEVHHYGQDSELQRVGIWRNEDMKQHAAGYWIVYDHPCMRT